MDKEEFWRLLKTGYGYRTEKKIKIPFGNIRAGASFLYYTKLLKLIFDHGIIAGRGKYDRNLWAKGSIRVMEIVESVGGSLNISGLSHRALYDGPVVYVANHMSMIEAFFLPGLLLAFGDISFVVKKSLLDYPFFGHVMSSVNPIAVSRKNPRHDLKTVLTQGKKRIKDGSSVIVFPQATRTTVFDGSAFNSLGIKLAKRAGADLVPVAIKSDFQGTGRIMKDFGPVYPEKEIRIKFGPVISVEEKPAAIREKITGFISVHLKSWGIEVINVPE